MTALERIKLTAEAFADIYRSFYQGKNPFCLIMVIISGFLMVTYGSLVTWTTLEGFIRFLLIGLYVYTWVFILPATIFLIDRKLFS